MENKIMPLLLIVLLFLASCAHAAPGQDADRVQLDADRISFEESSGIAEAEGDVRISNAEMKLLAPFAKYDSGSQQISANSSPEKPVVLISGGRQLNGESLNYNLLTKRGTLTNPSGKIDELYVKGDVIQVMPLEELSKKKSKKKSPDSREELAGRWLKTSVTTCGEANPHYRIETKELVVIPGKRVIIKKPRVYLGKHLVFVNPFDYILPANKDSKYGKAKFLPKLGHEQSKGAGAGISIPYAWESGSLYMDALSWSKGLWEGEARLDQELPGGVHAWGLLKREYDKDRRLTLWRPQWGFDYSRSGWDFDVKWSQREIASVRKRSGTETRYVLWRKPEINVKSQWQKDAASPGYYRLMGTWGRYEDATNGQAPDVERLGAGVQLYGEFKTGSGSITPFYNTTYWYYRYNDDKFENHQILNGIFGVRWGVGNVGLETAYLRRWTWGGSPMEWDNYEPLEEVYQQVGIRIPANSKKQVWWEFKARGAYSITDDKLSEMVYKVAYDQHCLLWEAVYRDDLIADDDWVGLKLTIKAYPEHGTRLTGQELFDPFMSPDKLPVD